MLMTQDVVGRGSSMELVSYFLQLMITAKWHQALGESHIWVSECPFLFQVELGL